MNRNNCRVCMKTKEDSLFSLYEPSKKEKICAADIIALLAQVEIARDDQLPQSICSTCLNDLEVANYIIQTCKESDRQLRHTIIEAITEESEPAMIKIPEPLIVSPNKEYPPVPPSFYDSTPQSSKAPVKRKLKLKKVIQSEEKKEKRESPDITPEIEYPKPHIVSPNKEYPPPFFYGTKPVSSYVHDLKLDTDLMIDDDGSMHVDTGKLGVPLPFKVFADDLIDLVFDHKKNSAVYARYTLFAGQQFFRVKYRPGYIADDDLPIRRPTNASYKNSSQSGLIKFHLVPMNHMPNECQAYANMHLKRVIPYNDKMNNGPWKLCENEDLKVSELNNYTEIHIGELRQIKDGMETFKILMPDEIAILNRIFRVRLTKDKKGKYHVVCRAFYNENPKTSVPNDFNVSLLEIYDKSCLNIFDSVTLKTINTVNGEAFDVKKFIEDINRVRRNKMV